MEKVGRNEPCPCGSGKKFKNCHMKEEAKKDSEEKQKLLKEMAELKERNRLLQAIIVDQGLSLTQLVKEKLKAFLSPSLRSAMEARG